MVSPCKTVHTKTKLEASKTRKLIEKYVFYLDIKNSAEAKIIESKIKKLGGRVEVFLVDSVTHVVSDCAPCAPRPAAPPANSPHPWGGRRRADAMLERAALLQPPPASPAPSHHAVWSVPKVKEFLSRLWAVAYRKFHTEEKVLQEPYIKFEAADRKRRAVYKELSAWPELQLRGERAGCPFMSPGPRGAALSSAAKKRMTRKTKPRPKERVDVPQKQSGYCEICRMDYAHLADHERSATHINFVKNCSNFLSLDSLIKDAGADVEAFLKTNKPVTVTNGNSERRSQRKGKGPPEAEGGAGDPRKRLEVICNGAEPHGAAARLSPSLGHYLRSKDSPRENGSASPPPPAASPARPQRWRPDYYRVVGMSTKLRSSASFAPVPPASSRAPCNGLVVKFRRVRRSELSVLSDEAENFMFPKKEDSEDGEAGEGREVREACDEPPPAPAQSPSPLCLKWEQGRLRASEQVERLTYAFESVPRSEPWFHTFRRQDEGKENTKSIINYLDYFSKSLVLPYEMNELPPLKPNCCALSHARKPVESKSGPPRLYGTRGMKKMRKIKVELPCIVGGNPRKSPREHASTLAILGGLTHGKRSKFSCSDDSKSLPSIAEEDLSSDATHSCVAPPCPDQLETLFSSIEEDDEEFDEPTEGGLNLGRTTAEPDVIRLLQNFEECDSLETAAKEIRDSAQPDAPKRRRGYKFKKKNKTGWPPNKKKPRRDTGSACSSREPSSPAPAACSEEADTEEEAGPEVADAADAEVWVSSARELQPVVRVLKMEAKLERRLRSAGRERRLRRRPHR